MLKNNTQKSVGYSQRMKSNLVNKRPVIINQKENTTACQTESNEDNWIIKLYKSIIVSIAIYSLAFCINTKQKQEKSFKAKIKDKLILYIIFYKQS